MHNKVKKRIHVTDVLLDSTLKYEHVTAFEGTLMVHLMAQPHLRLELRVHLRLQLSCN